MIVDKINKYLSENEYISDKNARYTVEKLAGWSFERQFMTNSERENKGKLYMSSLGKCPRQLAYGFHGVEKSGRGMDGRSKMVFFQGDVSELTIVNLAKLAGCNLVATGLDQITVSMTIDGFVIQGHPDGILYDNGKAYLFECKSMSSFSFKAFEKDGTIDKTYKTQLSLYCSSLGLDTAILVALNKDNGVLAEHTFTKDESLLADCKKNISAVLASTADKLPEPMYQCNEKGVYPWQCNYCSWFRKCRPTAEQVLVGKNYQLREKVNDN
jgi:hypothetical protein